MTTLLSIIKNIFFTAVGIETIGAGTGTMGVDTGSFLENLFNAIPSNLLLILGSIAGIIFIINYLIKTFISLREKWRMSNLKFQKGEEDLARDEIDTELKKKKLEE